MGERIAVHLERHRAWDFQRRHPLTFEILEGREAGRFARAP